MPKEVTQLIEDLRTEISEISNELDALSKPSAFDIRGTTRKEASFKDRRIKQLQARLSTTKEALTKLQSEVKTGYDIGEKEQVGYTPSPTQEMPKETAYDIKPIPLHEGPRPEPTPIPLHEGPTKTPEEASPMAPEAYDINIERTADGGFIAPQGMTAEQLQIMTGGAAFGGMTPEEVKTAGEAPATPAPGGATGGKPPEGWQPTDYTDRSKFEDVVLQRLGGNPFMIDPNQAVMEADKHLPELFNHVFGGKIVWSDRHKLNKDQQRFWDDTVKQYHADVFNAATSDRKRRIDMYNFMMNRFDNEKKAKEAALKQIREWRKEERAEDRERRAEEREERAERREQRLERQAAEKLPEKVKDAISFVKTFASQMGDTGLAEMLDISPEKLKENPMLAAALGEKITDPRIKKLFEHQMNIIMEHYGLAGEFKGAAETPTERTIVEKRKHKSGRTLAKYSDGSIEWLD